MPYCVLLLGQVVSIHERFLLVNECSYLFMPRFCIVLRRFRSTKAFVCLPVSIQLHVQTRPTHRTFVKILSEMYTVFK